MKDNNKRALVVLPISQEVRPYHRDEKTDLPLDWSATEERSCREMPYVSRMSGGQEYFPRCDKCGGASSHGPLGPGQRQGGFDQEWTLVGGLVLTRKWIFPKDSEWL